jgi:hypothetical protein
LKVYYFSRPQKKTADNQSRYTNAPTRDPGLLNNETDETNQNYGNQLLYYYPPGYKNVDEQQKKFLRFENA